LIRKLTLSIGAVVPMGLLAAVASTPVSAMNAVGGVTVEGAACFVGTCAMVAGAFTANPFLIIGGAIGMLGCG